MNFFFQILFILFFCSCVDSKKDLHLSLIDNGSELTVIGDELINFGELIEGEVVDIEFIVKNTGTGDLIISKVSASCGCTDLVYPSDIIEVGESQIIKVTFDSKDRIGQQTKNITVVSNATPNIKILTIQGNISPVKN